MAHVADDDMEGSDHGSERNAEEWKPESSAKFKPWKTRQRKRESSVWKFYERNDDYSKTCKVCQKIFSINTSTGALRRHLIKHFGQQTEIVLDTAKRAAEVRISPTRNTVTVSGVDGGVPLHALAPAHNQASSSSSTVANSNIKDEDGMSPLPSGSQEYPGSSHLDSYQTTCSPGLNNRMYSDVWQHFARLSDGKTQCNYCLKVYATTSSTSGLRRHYLKHHGGDPEEEDGHNETTAEPTSESKFAVPFPITERKPTLTKKQQSSESSLENLAKILVVGYLPPLELEGPLAPLLLSAGKADLPSISEFIRRTYDSKLADIKAFLHSWTGNVAISLELWTSYRNSSYLFITAHLLTDRWKPVRVMLSCNLLNEGEDGPKIAARISSIFEEFHISNKITAITTAGDLVKSAVESGGLTGAKDVPSVGCFLEEIGKCVIPGLDSVREELETVRRFIRLIIDRNKFGELKNIAAFLLHDYQELFLDTPGSWVTSVAMMENVLKMQSSVKEFLKRNENFGADISEETWKILGEIHTVLNYFHLAALEIEKVDYPTLSNGLALLDFLHASVVQAGEASDASALRKRVAKEIADIVETLVSSYSVDAVFFATVLDPRHKLGTMPISSRSVEVRRRVTQAYARYAPQVNGTQEGSNSSPAGPKVSLMSQIIRKSQEASHMQLDELNQYLNTAIENPDVDPFQWWENHAKIYPHVMQMARDFLSIPATAAPSSYYTSKDNAIGRLRNRVDDGMLGMYACLNSWNSFDFVRS